MPIGNDIKSYIVREGKTIKEVTDLLNIKNNTNCGRANLSKKLAKNSIRADEMIEIANLLGYDIIWEKNKKE